jgi:LPS export ABC transporter protein LptC
MTSNLRRRRARLATLLLPLLLTACAGGRDSSNGALADATRGDPGFEATGAEIVETGADGLPRYRVRAAQISQDPVSRNVTLQQVELRLADEDGASWAVDARSGQMPADAQSIELAGNVQVRGRAAARDEPLAIVTDRLSYDFERQLARSDAAVTFTMGTRALVATGIAADLKAGRVRLESKVNGRFNPQ